MENKKQKWKFIWTLENVYTIDAYLRRVIFGEIARYLKHTMSSSQHIPFVNQGSTTII